MARRMLIRDAVFAITVDDERRVIEGASILVDDGRIEAVGWLDHVDPSPDETIDAAGMVVTPGLISAHHHISAPSVATRNFQTATEGSLLDLFDLGRAMNPDDAEAAALLDITDLLLGGTTTFADAGDSVHPEALLRAVDRSGARAVMGRYAIDVENKWEPAASIAQNVAAQAAFAERYRGAAQGRVRTWIPILFTGDTASDELLAAMRYLSEELAVPLTTHAAHSQGSVDRSLATLGRRPVEHLAAIGFLGPRTSLSHAIFVTDEEIGLLASTGTSVVVSPMTAAHGGMGVGPHGRHPEMLAQGISVALGADGGDYGPVSVHRAMHFAAGLFRDARLDGSVLPPETALEMATIHGARALGLEEQVGSLRVGLRADLVLWDTRRPEWRALIDPVANLVYSADSGSVHTVVVDGQVVVRDHKPTYGDLGQIIDAGEAAGRRAIAATGIDYRRAWPPIRR